MAQPLRIRDAAFQKLAAEFKERKGATTTGWFDHFVRDIVEAELKKTKPPGTTDSRRRRPEAARD